MIYIQVCEGYHDYPVRQRVYEIPDSRPLDIGSIKCKEITNYEVSSIPASHTDRLEDEETYTFDQMIEDIKKFGIDHTWRSE